MSARLPAQLTVDVVCPEVPHALELDVGERADNGGPVLLPLGEFADAALERVGKEWTRRLLADAASWRETVEPDA